MESVIDIPKGKVIPRWLPNPYGMPAHLTGMNNHDGIFTHTEENLNLVNSTQRVIEFLNAYITMRTFHMDPRETGSHYDLPFFHHPKYDLDCGFAKNVSSDGDKLCDDVCIPPMQKKASAAIKFGYDENQPDRCVYVVVTYLSGEDARLPGFCTMLHVPEVFRKEADALILLPYTMAVLIFAALGDSHSGYTDIYALTYKSMDKADPKLPGKTFMCCTTYHAKDQKNASCGFGVGASGLLANCTCEQDAIFGIDAQGGVGLQRAHWTRKGKGFNAEYKVTNRMVHQRIMVRCPQGIAGKEITKDRIPIEWNYDPENNESWTKNLKEAPKPTSKNDLQYWLACRCSKCTDERHGWITYVKRGHFFISDGIQLTQSESKKKRKAGDGGGADKPSS
jgi:hypothetical protein